MTGLPKNKAALAALVGWFCMVAMISGCYLPSRIEPELPALTPSQETGTATPAALALASTPTPFRPIHELPLSSPTGSQAAAETTRQITQAASTTPSSTFTESPTPPPSPSPTASFSPSPTQVGTPSPTGSPTGSPTAAPTLTASPALLQGTVSVTPTRRPSRTPTPTRTPRIAYSRIGIQKPGPLSRLVSPIQMVVALIPGANGTVRMELLGEDGRLLYRDELTFGSGGDRRIVLDPLIEFEIPSVAETGRLTVAVEDPNGLVIALSSVEVVLLSMGENDPYPSGDLLEPYFIQLPWSQQRITGGTLIAEGQIRPVSAQPVIFEIISSTGELLGSRQVQLQPGEVAQASGGYLQFEVEIPYTVEKSTWARLIVRQVGSRLPGDVAVSSVQVYLSP